VLKLFLNQRPLLQELKAHLESVIDLHQNDLNAGFAGTFLIGLLEKKYENAANKNSYWLFAFRRIIIVCYCLA